jgi:tight adherence protein C
MTALYVSVALGLVAAAGVMATVLSLIPAGPTNADVVEHRLRIYEQGQPVTTTEIELQQPFAQRVAWPLIRRIGRILEQTMPEKVRQKIREKVQLAGRPGGLSATDFITVRYLLAGLLLVVGIGIGLLTENRVALALCATIGAVVGLYGPMFWLNFQVSRHRNEIQLDLPDVIDVLVVCVEAGLTLEAAMEQVVEKYDHGLADEIARVLQEVRLGRPRLESLAEMGQRNGVEELNNFVQAVIQSEQLGAGIARILRTQSDEIRQRRLLTAQERGARASLKMLLPMIGCIFPTLWIILLGPAALLAVRFLRGG